jgi:hypothetical protein
MKKPNSVEIAHSQNYERDNTQSCKRQIIIKQTEIEEKFLHTTKVCRISLCSTSACVLIREYLITLLSNEVCLYLEQVSGLVQ